MQHGDHRHGEALDDVEHVLAVRSAEDAVLVLHDGDVEVVEDEGGVDLRATSTADPLVNDGEHLHLRLVDEAHDTHVRAGALQVADERSANVAMPHWVGGKVDRKPNLRDAMTACFRDAVLCSRCAAVH